MLSSSGLHVTHIDRHYTKTELSLSEIMERALNPELLSSPEEQKFNEKLVSKLKYCREVIQSIRTAHAGRETAAPKTSTRPTSTIGR